MAATKRIAVLRKKLAVLFGNDEEPDELGFTPSDYYDMQRLRDKAGIAGDSLIGGFDITAEQIQLINGKDKILCKLAVDCFYFANLRLIRKMAYVLLRNNARLMVIVSYDDLCHQLYLDLCAGFIKLNPDSKQICKVIYKCFNLTAVGGLGVLSNGV